MKKISDILKSRVLILDGATGTELSRRGMPAGVCPELWALKNPSIIKAVHADYTKAGSDIVYTCTFGANKLKLKGYGAVNVKDVNRRLALLAREAVGSKIILAGDMSSTGHFVKPFGPLEFEEAVDIFKEQARGLLSGGVDIFVIETMMDIQEARAALIAVKEVTDKFVMVTMTYEKDGRTINGTDPLTALITLQSLGADAVGANCSAGPEGMLNIIKTISPYAKVPLVAKPNAGMPKLKDAETVFEMGPAEFSSLAPKFISSGVSLIGGCCGTTSEHIKALKNKILRLKPVLPALGSLSALTSSRKTVFIKDDKSVLIIGERINPTGKKQMQQEFLSGNFSSCRALALEQEQKGASVLDVNVGVPRIDEKSALVKAVQLLSVTSSLPLSLDSSEPEAIAAALRVYPGRALINSLSLEKEKISKLLPVIAKYGAMFILLPLSDKGIPKTLDERKKIIEEIYRKARGFGLSKDDFIVDALIMSIASNPEYADISLATIDWCRKVLSCKTIVGLSNISFGMPNRALINATFLGMARFKGLTTAIADPGVAGLLKNKAVKSALKEKINAGAFFKYFSSIAQEKKPEIKPLKNESIEKKISRAILEADKEKIQGLIKQALALGLNAYSLIDKTVVPAIMKVGELFDRKEYFLPQLIASAETTKLAFDFLKPHIKRTRDKKGKLLIVMATVQGDIHDIGKNIVVLMLESHGFEVLDLGKDVSAKRIIEAAKRKSPGVVGLSALMTTTMVRMPEVIALARKEKLKCKFMIGGAAVTKQYADSIRAEYARDATEAVRLAKKLINMREE